MTSGRARILHLSLVALFAAAAFLMWKLRIIDTATVPFRGDSVVAADFYCEIYPGRKLAAEWIRQGILPLWNPYQFAGHPYLATGIYGVLYPLNALHLVMPPEVAMEATIVVHFALAGVFMFAFARALDLSLLAAFGAGLLFMWSGFFVGEALWFPPAVAAATWLPLGLLAIEQIVRTRRVVWAPVLAASIALGFMAGWPQTWMYSLYALVAFATVRIVARVREPSPGTGRVVALVAFGFVLGGALMAVQLLPQLELQRLGPRRVGGLSDMQSMIWVPLTPRWFLDQVLNTVPGELHGAYIGIATLLVVALSVFAVERRAVVVAFGILGAFSAGVALGAQSPFLHLYRAMPGLAWFRGPQRIIYLYAVAAAVLGGVGLDLLLAGPATSTGRRRLAMIGIVTALAAGVVGVCIVFAGHSRTIVYMTGGVALTVAAILTGGAVRRHVLVAALVVLIAWDLYHVHHNRFWHPYHDVAIFDEEARLWDYVKANQDLDRTYVNVRANLAAITHKQGTMRQIYSITDYEPLTLARFARFYRLLESTHLPDTFTFMGALWADPQLPSFPLLDLLSVRFMIAPLRPGPYTVALDLPASKWKANSTLSENFVLYENTDVLPRSYVAHLATHVADEDGAFAAVAAPGFEPRTTVVIEDGTTRGPDAAPRPISPARIVRYDPTAITIEADATNAGYLVLTDTFYPGWQATVDGVATPILPANYLFRAVPIAAGRHTVVFRYTPMSFRVGLAVTLLGLVVSGVILAAAAVGAGRGARRASRYSSAV